LRIIRIKLVTLQTAAELNDFSRGLILGDNQLLGILLADAEGIVVEAIAKRLEHGLPTPVVDPDTVLVVHGIPRYIARLAEVFGDLQLLEKLD
jgi:hypothetical protein